MKSTKQQDTYVPCVRAYRQEPGCAGRLSATLYHRIMHAFKYYVVAINQNIMADPSGRTAAGATDRSPLPLKEAAAWNLTEKSIRETKLREALVALDSDRLLHNGIRQPSFSAHADLRLQDTDANSTAKMWNAGDDEERKSKDGRELNGAEVDEIIAAARGILGQTLERIDPYPARPAARRDSNVAVADAAYTHRISNKAKSSILFDPESRSIVGTLDGRFDDANTHDEDGMSLPSAINDSGSLHHTAIEPADGPSVFVGELPPRPVHAGANQHMKNAGHMADVGSCGSSIATTDLHSLKGGDGGTGRMAMTTASSATGGEMLRIPPSRLPPGSQMDHSLATTDRGDAASVPHSEGTAANESLAWRAALQDGPGQIRTTVELQFDGTGRPPLGQVATPMAATTTAETTMHDASTFDDAGITSRHHHHHQYGSGATTASIASSPVSTILSHNRTLQARAAHDAQRMEEMAVSEAEAREELALLRAQHQHRGQTTLTLQDLRGEILHRTREELAAASGEVVRLRTELEEARNETDTCQATLSMENSALRDEIRNLSAQVAQRTFGGGDSTSMGSPSPLPIDSNFMSRVTSAEATAAELRRQLEATKDTAEREAERAVRAERERDTHKEEAELATKRLAAARDEVREVRRDRDGLRGELTELLRARKNPEQTTDKEFGAEVERLRRVADQAREDADKKGQDTKRLQLQHSKDLEVAQEGEAMASANADKLKRGLKTLVEQLRSLERAGELGSLSVNQILITSQGSLSSTLNTMLMDEPSAAPNRKVTTSEASTQAQKDDVSSESIGINTTVTASIAANLFAEGLQTKADLRAAELRISKLQIENTDLQGKYDHLNSNLNRIEEEKREESAALSAKVREEDAQASRLSLLCEELKTKCAQLEQDNGSLTEKQSYFEDQNRVLVRRAVELEVLADEAQADVERLTNELRSVKAKLECQLDTSEEVKELKDDKARVQAEWEEARRECELLQQELLDATENVGRYREQEKELQSRIATLSSENSNLSGRLETAQKDIEAQRNENSTMAKSKLDYEWRCTNLGEEVAVLKEKLKFYQCSADAREDKSSALAIEKLDLEKQLKECREEIVTSSRARDKAQKDAKQLRRDNDTVKAELKVCAEEWRAVRDKFERVIEDKARLEKEVTDLEAQYHVCMEARSDAEHERDTFCSENETIKVELTSFRDRANDLTNQLNRALDAKRELEERQAESEREWRDACVQASALIQSPAQVKARNSVVDSATSPLLVDFSPSPIVTRAVHAQTDAWTTPGAGVAGKGRPTDAIDVTDEAVAPSIQSPPAIEASTANDVVNDMKAILAEIQSSLSASQAEAEQTKLKSRLDAEKEVESLRISLETSKEHIVRLKGQIPAFRQNETGTTSNGTAVDDSAFDERILRIKEARERATLACAYQEKLAEITSPDRREGAVAVGGDSGNHRQLADLSNKRQQESSSERRENLQKSLAELRSLRKRDEERRMGASLSGLRSTAQKRPAGGGSVNGRSSRHPPALQPVYLLSPLPVSTTHASAAATASVASGAAASGMISPLPIDASVTTAQLGTTSMDDIMDILHSCA